MTVTVILTAAAAALAWGGVWLWDRRCARRHLPPGAEGAIRTEQHELIHVDHTAVGIDSEGHVVLIAHPAGGRAPLALCLGHPDRVRALALAVMTVVDSLRVPDDARDLDDEAGEGTCAAV